MPARKSHKKTRSGCAQCKARRIKCDETKPKCVKCTMRKFPCSFSEIPRRAASCQTDLQDNYVRNYNPTANDLMWYLNHNICGSDFSFPTLYVDPWLNTCWSIPNIGLFPALQSNSALTAINMENFVWSQSQTMLPILKPNLQDSTPNQDFSSKLEDPENTAASLCWEPPTSHYKGEDLLLLPPTPAVAIEPNLKANLERDGDRIPELTSLHGVTPRTDTTTEHIEKHTTCTDFSRL